MTSILALADGSNTASGLSEFGSQPGYTNPAGTAFVPNDSSFVGTLTFYVRIEHQATVLLTSSACSLTVPECTTTLTWNPAPVDLTVSTLDVGATGYLDYTFSYSNSDPSC